VRKLNDQIARLLRITAPLEAVERDASRFGHLCRRTPPRRGTRIPPAARAALITGDPRARVAAGHSSERRSA
jgi:hypothetical protein